MEQAFFILKPGIDGPCRRVSLCGYDPQEASWKPISRNSSLAHSRILSDLPSTRFAMPDSLQIITVLRNGVMILPRMPGVNTYSLPDIGMF